MYKIAICGDKKIYIEQIRKTLLNYAVEIEDEIKIESFAIGYELCQYIKNNVLNLIFLDIEMNNMNGIYVAHYIREELDNHSVQIVCIAENEQYIRQMLEVHPLNFIEKPLDDGMIRKCFMLAYTMLKSGRKKFVYMSEYEKKYICEKDIVNFNKQGKDIEIYTKNDSNDWFRGTIKGVEEILKGGRFVKVNQSVIVNVDYIREIRNEKVIMLNGREYKISRESQNTVKSAYYRLMMN